MRKKSQVHETLSDVFRSTGVPYKMVVDGSKEQTSGKFRAKLRHTDCHLEQTEPYRHNKPAETAIRELKRGADRKMAKMNTPRRLWDDCIQLEALIRSNMALNLFGLKGQVPETVVTEQTADTSALGEIDL